MKFWFVHSGDVSIHDQIVTQVSLGVLAGDPGPGEQLPSIRTMAQRFDINAATVSAAYRELEREFAVGDRLGFTAPSKELGVANRDLGTVQRIDKDGQLSVKMDNGRSVSFDTYQMRHFDHGYAVTSHSSQGLTANRVLVNVDTHVHPELINSRFAYVSISRASFDAQVFTNDASSLATNLGNVVDKLSALSVSTGLNT